MRHRASLFGAALLALALVGLPASPAAAPPPPEEITVAPNGALVDGQQVTVSGRVDTDFGLMEIFQCRAGAVDELDCDLDVSDFISIGADGTFAYVGFPIDARIFTMSGDEVDCRAAPGTCTVGVGFVLDADEALHAPLVFDPAAPLVPAVTATATPNQGLVDGQLVRIQGEHLSDLHETFVYQCVAGEPLAPGTCAFTAVVRVVSQGGRIDVEVPVRTPMQPTTGPTVDCAVAPGACELRVSSGLSEHPDRLARLPLSFTTPEPSTTTSTTTTTAPATTTTARPAPATPTYTG